MTPPTTIHGSTQSNLRLSIELEGLADVNANTAQALTQLSAQNTPKE
ncbi:hypothetical protein Z949_1139 [Sulfitobacter guttiformis KCTC 32187]|nr:hypothetical protein Z949_1139 [Sulfitobacter guttiformis KCTC 32187]